MRSRSRGHTLLELCVVLALLALLIGLAAPPVRRAIALARVHAARDLMWSQLARARALAVARGGAGLVLDAARAQAWIEAADTSTGVAALAEAGTVAITVDGAQIDRVRIEFDGLGLGRIASRTLRFRSGGVEAGLTLSSYGRVRVW